MQRLPWATRLERNPDQVPPLRGQTQRAHALVAQEETKVDVDQRKDEVSDQGPRF